MLFDILKSTVPDDLVNQSLGIINRDFKVANNTLFSHSRTADGVGIFTKQANQVLKRPILKEPGTVLVPVQPIDYAPEKVQKHYRRGVGKLLHMMR